MLNNGHTNKHPSDDYGTECCRDGVQANPEVNYTLVPSTKSLLDFFSSGFWIIDF